MGRPRDFCLKSIKLRGRLLTLFRLPKHALVVASAWASRIVVVTVQIASVRILIGELGLEQYAVFALMISLSGWYALADLGIGVSVQNHLSESRAKGKAKEGYMATAGALAILLLIITIALLYFASPYLGPLFLKQFNILADHDKAKLFATGGALLIGASIGGIAYKTWYAEQRGYWSSIVPAIASVLGLGGVLLVGQSAATDKLYLSLIAYLLPPAVIPVLALMYQFASSFGRARIFEAGYFSNVLRRAGQFWFFGIMAAAVLQIDYVVLSQFLKAHDIATYNISTKVFGLAFFVYQAVLAALWPVFAEAIANTQWEAVEAQMQRTVSVGLIFMALSTMSLVWLMPLAFRLLAPTEQLAMSTGLIFLLGIYYMVRIWTDSFAMLLQSMSDLRPFWIYVPIQALISVAAQWVLAPIFGLYGVVFGLLASFLFTVSWALPLAAKRHCLY